ncbi:MAG TPA: VOC family protein [Miltoncostaeaceae bacterium]|nr:VOC family protein [Miltoncostaeaceae bacterium]
MPEPGETSPTVPERDGYPAGVPCWVDTSQPDPAAAARFYGDLFGWECEDRMPPDVPGSYYMARLRGRDVAGIGSAMPGGSPTPVWMTYIAVDSADATAERVREAGGQVLLEPFDVFDAGRMAMFADAEGAVFAVWQAGLHPGAGLVNEPGTVVFNGLNCRDPETARAFYGRVFGWEVDLAGDGFTMWRLPGYGEHPEARDPGLRARLESAGAPPGFADVVASLASMGDRHPEGTPPHWDVTFSSADADATAARAEELGGAVVVPPFDAPWVRMTVLRDPQGAHFIASTYRPDNAPG